MTMKKIDLTGEREALLKKLGTDTGRKVVEKIIFDQKQFEAAVEKIETEFKLIEGGLSEYAVGAIQDKKIPAHHTWGQLKLSPTLTVMEWFLKVAAQDFGSRASNYFKELLTPCFTVNNDVEVQPTRELKRPFEQNLATALYRVLGSAKIPVSGVVGEAIKKECTNVAKIIQTEARVTAIEYFNRLQEVLIANDEERAAELADLRIKLDNHLAQYQNSPNALPAGPTGKIGDPV